MRLSPLMRYGVVLLAIMPLFTACSRKEPAGSGQGLRQAELEEIGEFYRSYLAENKRPPTKLADVKGYALAFPEGIQALNHRRCMVNWGLDLNQPAAAGRVLAYEKDVPQQGGLVLMGDRTIKRMTAEEFQAADRG